MRRIFWLILCGWLCLAGVGHAATQTINTLPSSDANFITDLQTFFQDEQPEREQLYAGTNYDRMVVVSGGVGATDASLSHTISACVAFPNGYYVSQASVSHTYTANKRTFVYLRDDDSRTIAIGGAVITYDDNFVFVEMASGSAAPTLPTGILALMQVDTDGTSITAVEDKRITSSRAVSIVGYYGNDLTAAIAAIGAVTQISLLIDNDGVFITGNTTVTSNIELVFTGPGLITGAYTLTINGGMLGALDHQLFASNVTVAGLGKIATIKPEWWGAFPDNATDYGTELQAALDAMPVGSELLFSPGTYITSTALVYKPNRAYRGIVDAGSGSAIKQDDSSNITTGIFVSEGYDDSSVSPDDPVIFRDLTILGNKANNASASTVGILSTNYDSIFENILIYQTKGDGLKFDNTFVASGAVGNVITSLMVRQSDGDGVDVGVRYTDGKIVDSEIGSAALYCINNAAAGWIIANNAVYDCGYDGIMAAVGWNTTITGNIVDGWGQSSTTSDYRGIWLNAMSDGLSNTISGNSLTMKTADIIATTNYIGIHANPQAAATTALCAVTGNSIAISATATTSEGIRYAGSGGSGKLIVTGNITQNIDATKEIVDGTGSGMNDVYHSGNSFDNVVQTLAGSGTASVLYGSVFKTGDTNIVYSNFTNGFEGQRIRVIFDYDAGTGYVDFTGTNLKRNVGTDWYFNQYDSMECVFDGTNWYCDPADVEGYAVYDFSIDGGGQGFIPLKAFPDNATITDAEYEVITPFTSGGAATVSFGVQTADIDGLKTATAFDDASYAAGYHDFTPDGTAANYTTKTAVRSNVGMTIATADLNAGKVIIRYKYIVSE